MSAVYIISAYPKELTLRDGSKLTVRPCLAEGRQRRAVSVAIGGSEDGGRPRGRAFKRQCSG